MPGHGFQRNVMISRRLTLNASCNQLIDIDDPVHRGINFQKTKSAVSVYILLLIIPKLNKNDPSNDFF